MYVLLSHWFSIGGPWWPIIVSGAFAWVLSLGHHQNFILLLLFIPKRRTRLQEKQSKREKHRHKTHKYNVLICIPLHLKSSEQTFTNVFILQKDTHTLQRNRIFLNIFAIVLVIHVIAQMMWPMWLIWARLFLALQGFSFLSSSAFGLDQRSFLQGGGQGELGVFGWRIFSPFSFI